jgi:hypothetical protein
VLLLGAQVGDLFPDGALVLLQQGEPFGDGVVAAAGQLGVALHARDRHAGVAQAAQQAQPAQVVVGEDPLPARGAPTASSSPMRS